MTALTRSTQRRLQKLKQVPSVWEGDRRLLDASLTDALEAGAESKGECLLWVDGTETLVRAMDIVPTGTGTEALVRTLIRAMENPHSSAQPSRPQKIVVRDREIQFFLRGVLQDLGITVDYAPELPLIDEIFRGLQEAARQQTPFLLSEYAEALLDIAAQLWHDAPWEALNEEKILEINLNYGDVETLYVSILGMMGVEYGILMYRSLDSLRQFRQQVLGSDESSQRLEEAFLEQDCFFLTFDQLERAPSLSSSEPFSRHLTAVKKKVPEDAAEMFEAIGLEPSFGNIHPLEGMRPSLDEEESPTVLVALTALHRFFKKNRKALGADEFPAISGSYRIPDPQTPTSTVSVGVATRPDLAKELFEIAASIGMAQLMNGAAPPLSVLSSASSPSPIVRDDLVPSDSFFSLGAMPWDVLDVVRHTVQVHQVTDDDFLTKADDFPLILIQTSRPKALKLIQGLQEAGGLQAICFNPGEDPFAAQRYDLGLLQANNGDLFLFGEFEDDDPVHMQARKKWDQRCQKTKGHCGLVIARGLKGASRGNPDLKDMMALFEVRSLSAQDLGLGSLELMPQFE